MSFALNPWAQDKRQRLDRFIAQQLPPVTCPPSSLSEATRYAVLNGGKRLRPLLAYAAGEMAGASLDALDVVAAALEFTHCYSLVHDDMPCMDDDVLRRGMPTVHAKFGEAIALLVGDSLQAISFAILAKSPHLDDQMSRSAIATLATAAGPWGMVGGQGDDIVAQGKTLDEVALRSMHARKTGALLRASVLMGVACGQASIAPENLARYTDAIGLGYQVIDDILDVVGSTEELGKTANKDHNNDKPTYVSILGLEQAQALGATLHQQALASLADIADAQALRAVTDLLFLRHS